MHWEAFFLGKMGDNAVKQDPRMWSKGACVRA